MSGINSRNRVASFKEFLNSNPSIEEILSNDFTEDEIMSGNVQLAKYITKDHLKVLLTMITEEPPEDADQKRAYKFPLVASQFFAGDLNRVLDLLFEDESLIQTLFSFLNKSEKLNYLLAGYFRKAFDGLLSRNQGAILKFVYTNSYHTVLLSHIYSQSIGDILFRCLTGISQSESYLNERLSIVDGLISKLADSDPIVSINAEATLSRLISEKGSSNSADLVARITSSENIEKIFLNLNDQNKYIARSSAKLLKSLLMIKGMNIDSIGLADAFCKFMEFFAGILQSDSQFNIKSTFGEEIKTLGEAKIILAEVIILLVSSNNASLRQEIINHQILQHLTTLFVEYEWNSAYQTVYLNLIQIILQLDSLDLKIQLFQVLPKYLVNLADNPEIQKGSVLIRRGIMAHVYKIANLLTKQKYIQELQDILLNTEGWNNFEINLLDPYLELEKKTLGGSTRFNLFDLNSSEEEGPRLELDLDKLINQRNALKDEEEEEDLEEFDEGECDDIPDLCADKPMTGKDLEELSNMFDFGEENPTHKDLFTSTICIKTATLEEFGNTDYLNNNYWKVPINSDNVPDLVD
ncbi:PPP6R1 [Blepharisma stoltei]|uniref:Uncharacterized protein n=1 Tax=Blepharisma stoltei TaxID=1481888 RepID=A0AAU9I9B5_9CILI|nr:unnamed protein product [Blepharisma stoltei]